MMATDQDDSRSPSTESGLRAFQRFAGDWEGELHCPSWQEAERIATLNISRGGMFLRTSRAIPVDGSVKVTLRLPDSRVVELQATVRHVVTPEAAARSGQPAGLGIEVAESCRNELMALVEIARLRQGKETTEETIPATADSSPPAAVQLPRGPVAAVVGIDFGVTYSSLSVAIGDTVYLVPDEQGRSSMPSLLYVGETGDPLAGWAAREAQANYPERALPSLKRLLGQRHDDPRVGGILHALPFQTTAGPEQSILVASGETPLPVPQLCAQILRGLLRQAEATLKCPVKQAVISHPVTFGPLQKQALTRAAQIAGLEVVGLIEEPVAAALAYGHGQGESVNEIVAVYDFGGGTFDFTVLDMSGGSYHVLASEGDGWLGGDDFDRLLAEGLANAVWRRTGIELRHRVVEWQQLLLECERVKCLLSTETEAVLQLPELPRTDRPIPPRQKLVRPALERICGELLERSLEVCQRALASINLEPREITQVVATGGTTAIPFIRRGIERFFERTIAPVVDPRDAIALGAGLHAARLAGQTVRGVQALG